MVSAMSFFPPFLVALVSLTLGSVSLVLGFMDSFAQVPLPGGEREVTGSLSLSHLGCLV